MTGRLPVLKGEEEAGRRKRDRDFARLAGRRERVPLPEERALTVLPGPDRVIRGEVPSRRPHGQRASVLPEFDPTGRSPAGKGGRSPAPERSKEAHAPNDRPVANGPNVRSEAKERPVQRDAPKRQTAESPRCPVWGVDSRGRATIVRFPGRESSRGPNVVNGRLVANGPNGRSGPIERRVRRSAPKGDLRDIPPAMKGRNGHDGRASGERDNIPPLRRALGGNTPMTRTAPPVRVPIALKDPSAPPLGESAKKGVLIGPENPIRRQAGPPLQDQPLPGNGVARIGRAAPTTRVDERTPLGMRENPDLPKGVMNAPNGRNLAPGALTDPPPVGVGHRRNRAGAPRRDPLPRPVGPEPRGRRNGEAGVDPSASLSS